MSEKRTNEIGTWNSHLSARAAKLTEKGAHYFVGWLISAGAEKPEVLAEFERALQKLETDPNLQFCWKESGADAVPQG